jgi:hypothetical protein
MIEALDSMQYGYSPFVVKEACGDRHESVNDNNVRIIYFMYRLSNSRDTCRSLQNL